MKSAIAKRIANQTHESYEQMAKEFSASRARFWDELVFLAEHTMHDDHVLDIGCGNGRFAPLITERHAHYDGLDYSAKLIREARDKFPELTFTVGNATTLPYPDNSFDIAYAFAVIHHIPGAEARQKFVEEAARVLHHGGKFIFTAWDLWSPRYFLQLLKSAIGSLVGTNDLDVGDIMLTFGKDKWPRYVHACTARELTAHLTASGFSVIASERIARPSGEANIVIVAQKT